MKTDLSPAAEKAIHLARTDSLAEELDLVRLLSALVADEESLPAERLLLAGCRLAELRGVLEGLSPQTSYQRKFLVLARETATDHLETTVTGEYLLLTLLTHQPDLREVVEAAGGVIGHLLRPASREVIRTEEGERVEQTTHEGGVGFSGVATPPNPPSDKGGDRRAIAGTLSEFRESVSHSPGDDSHPTAEAVGFPPLSEGGLGGVAPANDSPNSQSSVLFPPLSEGGLGGVTSRENSTPPSAAVQRVCDVNANRIRESLRILDDYARFARNDPRITQLVKTLRHDFVAVLRDHPTLAVLESRDTVGDVGTVISTPGEQNRLDVSDVARVNVKRLQESLRSLEEFGKIIESTAAAKVEQLRYRSYTLERELFVESRRRERLQQARLYLLVSAESCRLGLEATVRGAIAGGVSVVQLREKATDDRTLLTSAEQLRRWTRDTDTLFIVNDRPDVAKLVDADGVHLGQEDLPITAVRKILPPDMLLGVSTHNPEQLMKAIADGADYAGVGPTFPSTTKQFEAFAGLEFVRHAMTVTAVPAFAIGGINVETIRMLTEAGGTRAAVSAAITQSAHPEQVARQLLSALVQAKMG